MEAPTVVKQGWLLKRGEQSVRDGWSERCKASLEIAIFLKGLFCLPSAGCGPRLLLNHAVLGGWAGSCCSCARREPLPASVHAQACMRVGLVWSSLLPW